MTKSKLAIFIPTYNGEKYLQETLDSVEKLLPPADDIYIVDDKSQDFTAQIASQFQIEKKFKFKLIKNSENLGVSQSLDRAILKTQSSHDLILFLPQDDLLPSNFLQGVEDNFISNTTGLLISPATYIDSASKKLNHGIYPIYFTPFKSLNFCILFMGNYVVGPGAVIRTSFYDSFLSTPDLPLTSDWYMYLHLSLMARIKTRTSVEVKYRQHENNASTVSKSKNYHSEVYKMKKNVLNSSTFQRHLENLKPSYRKIFFRLLVGIQSNENFCQCNNELIMEIFRIFRMPISESTIFGKLTDCTTGNLENFQEGKQIKLVYKKRNLLSPRAKTLTITAIVYRRILIGVIKTFTLKSN
jgi:glycosyltransferase involved in cell wall biosynthesis